MSDTAAAEISLEESLRLKLQKKLNQITAKFPLEPTYKSLILQGPIHPPTIQRDNLFKKIGSDLRERIEASFVQGTSFDAGKKGKHRDSLEEGAMRTAFTLRECKKHEQEALIAASFGRKSALEVARKRKLEGMALGLQEQAKKQRLKIKPDTAKIRASLARSKEELAAKDKEGKASKSALLAEKVRKKEEEIRRKMEESKRKQELKDREVEERERLRAIEKMKQRERERELEMEKEKIAAEKAKEEALRKARMAETPQQALHRLYEPIFRVLWNMEFSNLGGTNPFRLVIDKANCESMGVPDYCDIIKKPMNLTYIQERVDGKSYETLQEFFTDVELMISNALLYNSDPKNEFHIATKELKKKYKKLAKRVIQSLQQKP